MRIVVLGGAGIIGRVIAQDLAVDVEEILIADRDLEGARRTVEQVGSRATAASVDVTDTPALVRILRGAGACINSTQYYFNLDVMRACLEARVPYLDLGGLFHVTRKQLELARDFEKAGVSAVLGLGSCPGVANVHAGWLGGMLDRVASVRIYNGSTLDEGESLAWPYAIETILDEISKPAMIFRGGEFREAEPLGEEEHFLFPEPIGWAKTHLSLHSEVATIPLSLADKGIEECTFKITFFGYSEAALRKLHFLAQLGLAGTERVAVDGGNVRPRDVLLELLRRVPQAKEKPKSKGFKDVATVVEGAAEGRRVVLRADTSGGPNPAYGVSGGTLLVAVPPAIVARWLAARKLERPGVWAPEQVVEPQPFFAELARRGFTTALTRAETIAAAT
ncbi:MAG TPA: saccharopine dehydrogenase NADP-binding domain-containing protein [Anaerolineales bacterium]|nr:saccharopine dehydrogenase NADP-binding domain-containing protein [Anaerolineales bacterium]